MRPPCIGAILDTVKSWIETGTASPARSNRGPLMPTIESGGGARVSTRSMCGVGPRPAGGKTPQRGVGAPGPAPRQGGGGRWPPPWAGGGGGVAPPGGWGAGPPGGGSPPTHIGWERPVGLRLRSHCLR